MRQNARRHLVAILALLVGVGLAYAARRLRPEETVYRADFSRVPMQVGRMEGSELPEEPEVAQYLEAEQMRSIVYGEPPDQVVLSLIYGGSWRTVHTPAQCYPAAGWRMVWEDELTLPIDADRLPHPGPVIGKIMRVERGEQVQMVMFVFAHKGGVSVDYTEHSWAVATGPPGAGGLSLMLSTAIYNDDEDSARQRLMDVAAAVYPSAVAFWYEDFEPGAP